MKETERNGPVALMMGSREMPTGVWWGNVKGGDHVEHLGTDRWKGNVQLGPKEIG
jgi:hypothetical protein